MFEALNKASAQHKYDLAWVKLEEAQFDNKVRSWLTILGNNSYVSNGARKEDRIALAQELLQTLVWYRHLLVSRSPHGAQSHRAKRVDRKIASFTRVYREKFSNDIQPQVQDLSATVKLANEKVGIAAAKVDVLEDKKAVLGYWLSGVRNFNKHLDDVSLILQYLGNAESSKVRLFLDVLIRDADKITKLADPRAALKTSFEHSAGLAKGEDDKYVNVTWTNEDFKKAVKAEVNASYGVRASGSAVLEVKGLKAELKASAFAGASFSAEAGATLSPGRGASVNAKVEAMLGIRIKAEANIDVADIFLIEASAEAFAGALAKGEVEITATYAGISVKVEAEVFAGARITGKGALTLRMCGYDIIKGEATAYLSAGIGASFKLGLEASAFGGTKLEIGAGVTMGVGGGADGAFTIYADNLGRVANSLFFTGYLTLLGRTQEKHAWVEYLRNLEDNEILFKKADEIIEEQLKRYRQEYDQVLATQVVWKQLAGLVKRPHGNQVKVITATKGA